MTGPTLFAPRAGAARSVQQVGSCAERLQGHFCAKGAIAVRDPKIGLTLAVLATARIYRDRFGRVRN